MSIWPRLFVVRADVTTGVAGSQEASQMRYAILIYDTQTANPSPGPPILPCGARSWAIGNGYTQMLKDTGRYLGGEALEPVTTATTVHALDGK